MSMGAPFEPHDPGRSGGEEGEAGNGNSSQPSGTIGSRRIGNSQVRPDLRGFDPPRVTPELQFLSRSRPGGRGFSPFEKQETFLGSTRRSCTSSGPRVDSDTPESRMRSVSRNSSSSYPDAMTRPVDTLPEEVVAGYERRPNRKGVPWNQRVVVDDFETDAQVAIDDFSDAIPTYLQVERAR